MFKKSFSIAFLFLFCILLSQLSLSSVGVGISPSRMVLEVEGGKTQQLELLIFNSGDRPMKIGLVAEGDIANFTTVEPAEFYVEPEPEPHALPIKNGKNTIAKFTPPASSKAKKYYGTISAIGSPTEGSNFGGSVGVATQIELIVTPTKSFLSYITFTHMLIAGIILLLLFIMFLLKRAGLSIKFEKKQEDSPALPSKTQETSNNKKQ